MYFIKSICARVVDKLLRPKLRDIALLIRGKVVLARRLSYSVGLPLPRSTARKPRAPPQAQCRFYVADIGNSWAVVPGIGPPVPAALGLRAARGCPRLIVVAQRMLKNNTSSRGFTSFLPLHIRLHTVNVAHRKTYLY